MEKLIFATNNTHKLHEVSSMLKDIAEVIGLQQIGIFEDIPETGLTLQENALQKANFVFERTGLNCFADDTGLEVEALDGRPGVFSARYAGEPSNSDKNIEKLLFELKNINNRNAQFITVIALIFNNKQYFFKGAVTGKIIEQRQGTAGFGYDSVFMPNFYDKTFAQLSEKEKNEISHRGKAVEKLKDFLIKIKNYA